jgi:hypothetical protein
MLSADVEDPVRPDFLHVTTMSLDHEFMPMKPRVYFRDHFVEFAGQMMKQPVWSVSTPKIYTAQANSDWELEIHSFYSFKGENLTHQENLYYKLKLNSVCEVSSSLPLDVKVQLWKELKQEHL